MTALRVPSSIVAGRDRLADVRAPVAGRLHKDRPPPRSTAPLLRLTSAAASPSDVLLARALAPVSPAQPKADVVPPNDNHWWSGRPLREARNAHRTNTVTDLNAALCSNANFLECDVRKAMHADRLECRHDSGYEADDNLSLTEWLRRGVASGRGLKVEIKEAAYTQRVLDEIARVKVPSERLMINMHATEIAAWGPVIRRMFPSAIIAISGGEGFSLAPSEVAAMVEAARDCGSPVTFVVRYDNVTDSAISAFKSRGTVSVWNEVYLPGLTNPAKQAEALRGRGVDGMIDLRPSLSLPAAVRSGLNSASRKSWHGVKDGAASVRDWLRGLWDPGGVRSKK